MSKKRPLCKTCQQKPRAVNYIKDGVRFYRTKCVDCIRKQKQEKSLEGQALIKSGYQKKHVCDRCNFQARHQSQLSIVFLDGNRLNTGRSNLRTYCANCLAELAAVPRSARGLVPDY